MLQSHYDRVLVYLSAHPEGVTGRKLSEDVPLSTSQGDHDLYLDRVLLELALEGKIGRKKERNEYLIFLRQEPQPEAVPYDPSGTPDLPLSEHALWIVKSACGPIPCDLEKFIASAKEAGHDLSLRQVVALVRKAAESDFIGLSCVKVDGKYQFAFTTTGAGRDFVGIQ